MSYLSTAIATVLSSYLSQELRIPVGLAVASGLQLVFDRAKRFLQAKWPRGTKQHRLILASKNPITQHLAQYLLHTYRSQIQQCELAATNGVISLQFEQVLFVSEVVERWQQHQIRFLVQSTGTEPTMKRKGSNDDDTRGRSATGSSQTKNDWSLVVASDTAEISTLQTYIEHICRRQANVFPDRFTTLYTVHTIRYGKDVRCEWKKLRVKLQNTEANTILSEANQQRLFRDVERFLQQESRYYQQGLAYKRGYLLHGPPGTGKSSAIKAIAQMYRMDIFLLDLSLIPDNAQLFRLTTEIHDVQRGRHILAIEDLDRSTFFLRNRGRYSNTPDPKKEITDDALLNLLDGIVSPHGRLTFLTTNNLDIVQKLPALIRPGRVDQIIHLDHCDAKQLRAIVALFFAPADVEPMFRRPAWKRIDASSWSPAALIHEIQCASDVNALLAALVRTPKEKTSNTGRSSSVTSRFGRARRTSRTRAGRIRTLRRELRSMKRKTSHSLAHDIARVKRERKECFRQIRQKRTKLEHLVETEKRAKKKQKT